MESGEWGGWIGLRRALDTLSFSRRRGGELRDRGRSCPEIVSWGVTAEVKRKWVCGVKAAGATSLAPHTRVDKSIKAVTLGGARQVSKNDASTSVDTAQLVEERRAVTRVLVMHRRPSTGACCCSAWGPRGSHCDWTINR